MQDGSVMADIQASMESADEDEPEGATRFSLDQVGDRIDRWSGKALHGREFLEKARSMSRNDYEAATRILGNRELQLGCRILHSIGHSGVKSLGSCFHLRSQSRKNTRRIRSSPPPLR